MEEQEEEVLEEPLLFQEVHPLTLLEELVRLQEDHPLQELEELHL